MYTEGGARRAAPFLCASESRGGPSSRSIGESAVVAARGVDGRSWSTREMDAVLPRACAGNMAILAPPAHRRSPPPPVGTTLTPDFPAVAANGRRGAPALSHGYEPRTRGSRRSSRGVPLDGGERR